MEWNITAIQEALDKPGGRGDDLPPEPLSHTEAMSSREWSSWEAAEGADINELINEKEWPEVPSPRGKVVLRTKQRYIRKIGGHGEVV